jgi:hypothetical protein
MSEVVAARADLQLMDNHKERGRERDKREEEEEEEGESNGRWTCLVVILEY